MSTREPHPDDELLRSVSALLQEFTREKRQAREPPASRWERFWGWWKTTGSGALALVTILSILVGGWWSFIQYHAQERDKLMQQRRELQFRRQSMIVEFHADLADRSKRNRAAYALATLAGSEAIPFLLQELAETAASEEDVSFQKALAQALETLGEPAFRSVLDLNRRMTTQLPQDHDGRSAAVIRATQRVILPFLRRHSQLLQTGHFDFAGILLQDVELREPTLEKVNLRGITIRGGSLRCAKLSGANLEGAKLTSLNLHLAEFRGAQLSRAILASSHLRGATFHHVVAAEASFVHTEMYRASFREAELRDSQFMSANLHHADFSGANLEGIRFYARADEGARIPHELAGPDSHQSFESGAFVWNANFQGAKHIDEETRQYLCRWGAVNVPGGCDGIAWEKTIERLAQPAGGLQRGGLVACGGFGW